MDSQVTAIKLKRSIFQSRSYRVCTIQFLMLSQM